MIRKSFNQQTGEDFPRFILIDVLKFKLCSGSKFYIVLLEHPNFSLNTYFFGNKNIPLLQVKLGTFLCLTCNALMKPSSYEHDVLMLCETWPTKYVI